MKEFDLDDSDMVNNTNIKIGEKLLKETQKVKERLGKVKARLRGKFNNRNSFNEYQINFYRPQLTPYEQLQQ